MANRLSEEFDVTVIGAKNGEETEDFGKKILYETLFFENELGKKLFAAGSSNNGIRTSNNNLFDIKSQLIKIAKTFCKKANQWLYNEPTYFKGIVSSYWIWQHGKDIIRFIKENKINLLIISIPPWNIISIDFLKDIKALGCKALIDYRDPWNCWNGHKGFPLRKESKIVALSDGIIVTNENHADKLIGDFNLPEDKVHIVMNGYDGITWDKICKSHPSIQPDSEMLTISFIGSIQFSKNGSFRDPTKFIEALSNFKYKDKIRFRIVGCYDESVIKEISGIVPNFEMIPPVTQEESYKWMLRSDVLVNFHTTDDDSANYLIGGKAFDYYRSGAKMLTVNSPGSYERAFIEKNNSGYYALNRVSDIINILEKIYSDWETDPNSFRRIHREEDRRYSREYQNEIALELVKSYL